jgi:hypothetical protein
MNDLRDDDGIEHYYAMLQYDMIEDDERGELCIMSDG